MQNSLFVRGMLAAFVAAASIAPLPAAADPPADVRALIGKTCPNLFSDAGVAFPGFTVPRGFVTVTLADGWIFPMAKGRYRYAFLVTGLGDVCKLHDVAELPDEKQANIWLQCHERDAMLEGFGMRNAKRSAIIAWWTIDRGKLKKMPDTKGVICQQPETGD
ncbi:MAG TPA: hypothetical protein VGF56_02930 [Rhizomicrobium sp.]|jgi:hypothetical protein